MKWLIQRIPLDWDRLADDANVRGGAGMIFSGFLLSGSLFILSVAWVCRHYLLNP